MKIVSCFYNSDILFFTMEDNQEDEAKGTLTWMIASFFSKKQMKRKCFE